MSGVPGQASTGRPKKPRTLKLLSGTLRRDRETDRPVPASSGATTPPAPPSGLSDASQRLWTAVLGEFEIDSAPQRELLLRGLLSRDLADACRARIDTDGLITESGKPHPLLSAWRDASAQAISVWRVLGLSMPPEAD